MQGLASGPGGSDQSAFVGRRVQKTGDGRGFIDEPLWLELDGHFDLIMANTPYVDAGAMAARPPEFCVEPQLGLEGGGDDGLDLVDVLLGRVGDWLAAAGVFICEVGASAPAFSARYPALPVIWLDLPRGGKGVFLLDGAALSSHTRSPYDEYRRD